jgi:aryl-alcohol dehydrogenase-like predicted oxidoreductase
MIETAGAAGVHTIDTARDYGSSEARIGELVPREGWRIVTKLAAQLPSTSSDDAVVAASASVTASLSAKPHLTRSCCIGWNTSRAGMGQCGERSLQCEMQGEFSISVYRRWGRTRLGTLSGIRMLT